jgi:hypothetical protein
MRNALNWSVLVVAALLIAAVPTRISSHNVAVGFPFTWHTRQEIVTLGEQPHTFSAFFLFCDFGIALVVLALVVKFFRTRQT